MSITINSHEYFIKDSLSYENWALGIAGVPSPKSRWTGIATFDYPTKALWVDNKIELTRLHKEAVSRLVKEFKKQISEDHSVSFERRVVNQTVVVKMEVVTK